MPDVHKGREKHINSEQTVAQLLPVRDGPGQCDEQHSQQANTSFASFYIVILAYFFKTTACLHAEKIKTFFTCDSTQKNKQTVTVSCFLCSLKAEKGRGITLCTYRAEKQISQL